MRQTAIAAMPATPRGRRRGERRPPGPALLTAEQVAGALGVPPFDAWNKADLRALGLPRPVLVRGEPLWPAAAVARAAARCGRGARL